MQPLSGDNGLDRLDSRGTPGATAEFARPLPRFLRRIIRSLNAFDASSLLRNRLARNCALGLAVAVAGFYVAKETPVVGHALEAVGSSVGFEVTTLVVKGNQHLSSDAVKRELSGTLGRTLFALDVETARTSLKQNRWIKSATVKKVFPDTLVVNVVEREPVALWKSGQTLIVISRDGIAIDEAAPKHMHLPQVVGTGANETASQFLSAISKFPGLVERSKAYVRVAERRWDVVINGGPKVLLPADDWQDALAALNTLQLEKSILDRDLVQIDMRLPDRLVLRLDSEAADVRRTTIENALKRDWHKT